MKGLFPDFIVRLQEALLVCAPFDDFTALTHLFVDERIYPWRKLIRYRPNSVGLIDEVIFQLFERSNQAGENALLLFLQVVCDRTDPEDSCYGQIGMLIQEWQDALIGPPEFGEPALMAATERPPDRTVRQRASRFQPANIAPPATSRLEALGFLHDPFAWLEAEKIAPPQLLEELFVAHPDFDGKVMTLNRATILVAPRGSGKTAGRLTLEERLKQLQQATSSPYQPLDNKRVVPFVVVYDQFEQLVPRLPAINLTDHQDLLAAAIAAALLKFVSDNCEQFLAQDNGARSWWWSYLATYLRGVPLHYAIANEQLRVDWAQLRGELLPPFAPKVSIKELLSSFLNRLQAQFGINNLFILVDGVDGYAKTQSAQNLQALLHPLLSALSLLSLPGIIWKFFLPSLAETAARDSAGYRTGRIDLFRLEWDESALIQLLQRRLSWASAGAVAQLDAITEQRLRSNGINLESELARIALSYRHGPPRALLVIAERLFRGGSGNDLTLLAEIEWFRFRRWIGQDVRAHQREQMRQWPVRTQKDLAHITTTLNSLNDDALFLVQRAWNELDFYPAEPGELEATLNILTRVLASAGTVVASAADDDIPLAARVKMLMPPVLAFLIHKTPVTVDAQWIPARVVAWLRRIADGWLQSSGQMNTKRITLQGSG